MEAKQADMLMRMTSAEARLDMLEQWFSNSGAGHSRK